MRYIKHHIAMLSLFLGATIAAIAQKTHGKDVDGFVISGKVIDQSTGLAVEYANVLQRSLPDSTVINGTVTNEKGMFKLEVSSLKASFIQVQFVGFDTFKSGQLEATEGRSGVNLGTIGLVPMVSELQEVSVVARKNFIESTIDKKIVSVDPMIVSTGGTALDVIKNVPSLTVDTEGNLSMRGSDNVTVLVDGRPSTYTSLDQVPAAIIDRVEVVTNPSAKYKASGMSGIVNIITKKKTGSGFNGQVSANAGTYHRYNGNVNLNYGTKTTGVFFVADGRAMRARVDDYQLNEKGVNLVDKTEQWSETEREMRFGSAKLGVDHQINKKNSLSLTLFAMGRKINTLQDAMTRQQQYWENTGSHETHSSTDYEAIYYRPNIQYKRLFDKKDRELTFDVKYSYDDPARTLTEYNKDSTNQYVLKDDYYNGTEAQINYSTPLFKKGKLEAGGSASLDNMNVEKRTETSRGVYTTASDEATSIKSADNALYVQFSNKIGKFQYQGGLRFEGKESTIEGTRYEKSPIDYAEIFPSAGLFYSPNDTVTVQVNYSKRVNYPGFSYIIPVREKSDVSNWSQGNPFLKSEFVHALELSFSRNTSKLSTTNTLFTRITTNTFTRDVIFEYDSLLAQEISVTTVRNGKAYASYGIEHFHNYTFGKTLRHTFSASLFINNFTDTSLTNYYPMPTMGWMTKYSITLVPVRTVETNLSVNYVSRVLSAKGGSHRMSTGSSAGIIEPVWQMDFTAKKTLWKNNASVSVRVSDIFNSSVFEIESGSASAHSYTRRKRDTRTLFIGFIYKINGGSKNKKRTNENMEGDM